MKRACPLIVRVVSLALSFVPFLVLSAGAGLLLTAGPASAQIVVTGPPTAAAHELTVWFVHHIPAKFQTHERFGVDPLSDAEMDAYVREGDPDSQNSHNTNSQDNNSQDTNSQDTNSQDDDGDIDGVFMDNPPRITLRVPAGGKPDYETFAHEYGHFVWFDLLSKDDRKRYEPLYQKQRAAHKLITDYAAVSVEEGFAEAFAAYVTAPAALKRQDALSWQFLSRWPGSTP